MTESSNDTIAEDGPTTNFYDLTSVERLLIAIILAILCLMGIIGNSVILYVIRGFKPSVSFY